MDDLSQFLQFVFGGLEGYVHAPVKTSTNFKPEFFAWPDQATELQDWITTSDRDPDAHCYISPVVYSRPKATKEFVKASQVCWIDFDQREKVDFRDLGPPTAIVQSSLATKLHCYWKIPPSSGEVVEEINHRIAYYLGADSGGWDSIQLLRPPSTTNRKYEHDLPVLMHHFDPGLSYQLDHFDVAPVIEFKTLTIDDPGDLPNWKEVLSSRDLPTRLIQMVKMEKPPVGSRSQFLAKLAFELAEEGLDHREVVSLLLHADERIEKFAGRNDQLLRLVQLAELAMFKVLAEDAITLYSYDDILHRTDDLKWILKPWLHTTGMMIISGAPSVGKTQIGLQLTSSLSLNLPFLQREFTSSVEPSIFFMSLEMGPEGLKYIIGHQSRELLAGSPKHYTIIDEEGTFTQYENIIEKVGATVILVDSLTELLDGTESETESKAARYVLKWLRKIRRRYQLAVILIHHNRKATEGNKKPKGLADLAGSFQFAKDSDTVVQLWEDHKGIEFSSVKCRYGEKEAFMVQRTENLWFERVESNEARARALKEAAASMEDRGNATTTSSGIQSTSEDKVDANHRAEPTESGPTISLDFDLGSG